MHSAPQHYPQQNSIYPSYFYQQLPFIYNPYPNPFYSYNYLNPSSGKFAVTKSESDKKSSQADPPTVEAKSAAPLISNVVPNQWHHSQSTQWPGGQIPYIPIVQYVPAYGRNLDSWSAKEIPVTVVVDEGYEKSYNVPYSNHYQSPYVRNYVEQSKQNPQQPVQDVSSIGGGHGSGTGGSLTLRTTPEAAQFISVQSSPIDKSQYVQGAPLIPNVAGINTPQASISFFPHYQGLQGLSYGRDLAGWNVNEIPISAVVVDEGAEKNTEK